MSTLQIISAVSIGIGFLCFVIILIDILSGNKQHMMIMNFVWPVTGLYAGPLALVAYFSIGRKLTHKMMYKNPDGKMNMLQKPYWQSVLVGALHCGSGCTLGDIIAESLLLFVPVTLLGSALYGSWLIDFILAFIIGIIFQYYAIKPMKKVSSKQALKAALKADALSLTSWQVGMYGGMAIATFHIFKHHLSANTFLFWFVMQFAMMLGFLTAYPVNWWLIKTGVKEKM
ncbi:MAG: DUF4396 domain-containing protein [Parafilimonas sp.]